MRRLLIAVAALAVLVVPAAAAQAEDITVGNCEHGKIASAYNNNGTTGETRIVVCRP